MTAALLTGRLLSVANVGDSLASLHDGLALRHVTADHRLVSNAAEAARLSVMARGYSGALLISGR